MLSNSPYVFTYNVDILSTATPPPVLIESESDLIQSSGTAGLAETLVSNVGATYNIDFTKTGASSYTGCTSVGLGPLTVWLNETDVLTLDGWGSNNSGGENCFIETVSEPVSFLVLSSGLVGLCLVSRHA